MNQPLSTTEKNYRNQRSSTIEELFATSILAKSKNILEDDDDNEVFQRQQMDRANTCYRCKNSSAVIPNRIKCDTVVGKTVCSDAGYCA